MSKSGEIQDNSKVILNTYAAYEDPELGMSLDPALVSISSTKLNSGPEQQNSCDHFSQASPLPTQLSLKTPVRIRMAGGEERILTFGQVLREAPKNPQAMEELLRIVEAKANESEINGSCFDPNDDNLSSILAQLRSADRDTRKEGAKALSYFILNHQQDAELQHGLLATVDQIHTPEAKQVLTEVYNRSSENSDLRTWMEGNLDHGLYLKSQAEHAAQQTAQSAAPLRNDAGFSRTIASSVGGQIDQVRNGPTAASQFQAELLTSLSQTISNYLMRSPELGIEASQAPVLAQRALQVSSTTQAGALVPTLRAVFMGAAWNHPYLSAQQFPQVSGMASDVAHAIARGLSLQGETTGVRYASDNKASVKDVALTNTEHFIKDATSDASDFGSTPTPVSPRGYLKSLLEFAINDGVSPIAPSLSLPTSTLATAGMQSALSFVNYGNGMSASSQSPRFSERPSYFIEDVGSAEGETQQGFSGNSQGNPSDQQEQENRQSPSEAYLA